MHLSALVAEQDAFAALAAGADSTLSVPACGSWTIAALVQHLSAVHRWAAAVAQLGVGEPLPDDEPYERAANAQDHPVAASVLRAALADPGRACPTLVGPGTVAWWVRRQLHETLVHRCDLAAALGVPVAADPAVAADCVAEVVAEVVDTMQPRQVHLGRMAAPEVGVRLRTPSGQWQLGGVPVAEVVGPEIAVALLLWRRASLEDPRLTTTGDRVAAAALLDQPLTA